MRRPRTGRNIPLVVKIAEDSPLRKLTNIFVVMAVMATFLRHQSSAQFFVDKTTALKDMVLAGFAFQNITKCRVDMCFYSCVINCHCMAFQMCEEMESCQLLSSNKHQSPSSLIMKNGCRYYDMTYDNDGPNCAQVSCCQTSPPCQNGGKCEPIFSTNLTPRFTCKCPPGFTGKLCEIRAKSCRSYMNISPLPGNYTIFDANLTLYDVFCDFSNNTAWTVIQSYQFQNNDYFKLRPLTASYPVQEDAPNWSAYRLSQSRMSSIQQDSTKFRMTCNYDTDGVVFTDYAQANTEYVDILNLDGDTCVQVDYIDIRGHRCQTQPCEVRFHQTIVTTFHIDASTNPECRFTIPKAGLACDALGEDNFGFYLCRNTSHRCSATSTSTTQIWFGGV